MDDSGFMRGRDRDRRRERSESRLVWKEER